MSDRARVLLLVPHLNSGGAARVSRNLALGLMRRGYDVHLATVATNSYDPDGTPSVQVHCLGASRVRWSIPALLGLIRRLRPALILSNMAHLNLAVLALRPLLPPTTRVLVRNDGGLHVEQLSRIKRAAWRQLHRRANAIICQSEQMAAELAVELGSDDLLRILPNPVDVEKSLRAGAGSSPWTSPGPNLLAVGRLVKQKGFDLLVQALPTVLAEFPNAQVVILGDGPEGRALQKLSADLGITGHLHLAGHLPDPEAWSAGATLYVQPSREDALPNALLEAAAAGLPIASTPSRGGVPSLLKNQPGTWMAAQVTAASLADVIAQALRGLAPGQRFAHSWIEPFAMPAAIARYDELICTVLS